MTQVDANHPGAVAARMHQTYEQAEYLASAGFISSDVWRWYLFFWTWCSPRFSGAASHKQDIAYMRLGMAGYLRRMQRASLLRSRLAGRPRIVK